MTHTTDAEAIRRTLEAIFGKHDGESHAELYERQVDRLHHAIESQLKGDKHLTYAFQAGRSIGFLLAAALVSNVLRANLDHPIAREGIEAGVNINKACEKHARWMYQRLEEAGELER